ncbi:MAG: exopolysaccharide biosynthesis polyprenyl glycosylphosphotransferase [Pseudomonadota bacterium]
MAFTAYNDNIVLTHSQSSTSSPASMKECFDWIVAATALVLLSPVLLIVAAAIKMESNGPVFFRQRRNGIGGSVFNVWKFRTMSVMEDGNTVTQASRNDSRVTQVGAFLRKTSIDELPQLINVLLGEMSLVGPRPHAMAHNEYYAERIANYVEREAVKPGITGWAQINGHRGETQKLSQMIDRVEHDVWYIRNQSMLLDLKIILLTPIFGLVHRNAF